MLVPQLIQKITQEFECPGFIYDLNGFREGVNGFKTLFEKNVFGFYACKSNPLSDFIKIAREAGLGVDVASVGELDQTLRCGVDPTAVIVTGPAKSKQIFHRFLKRGVKRFVVESLNQLHWLDECCFEWGMQAEVLLRIQLSWDRESHSVLGGNEISAFGLDPGQWEALNVHRYKNIDLSGFHFFQWGNVLALEDLSHIWDSSAQVGLELARKLGIAPRVIDIGGGLGIPYTDDEHSSGIPLSEVINAYSEFATRCPFELVYLEPGRYLSGPFGVYCTRILDRKTVRGRELLILEGGSNHILRPMLTSQGFPAKLLSYERDGMENSSELKDFYVHGPLCTALDKLGVHRLPASSKPGDWLIFSQCGAYGFTESMPFFLAHPLAFEAVVENGEWECRRAPEPPGNWLV